MRGLHAAALLEVAEGMAGWLRGRAKLAAILGLLKDQTAAGVARASGPFSNLRLAIVMATNHEESLPEERYVEEIMAAGAGPRVQVSFCTQLLVKRLVKTQSWCVALKCLVILHRCILDGSFLYQDLLAHVSMKEGKDYLFFGNFRGGADWEYCLWVKNYARYLDERLCCSRAVKSHLDNKWAAESSRHRLEYMMSEEVLFQLEALQNLLQELCLCQPDSEAGEHPMIQGALVLVVTDSFKVYDEIRFRFNEMLSRANLQLSESLSLLHCCKRAGVEMQSLDRFYEHCKELRLFTDLPFPENDLVSEIDIRRLTDTIQSLPVKPSAPLYTKRSASVGRLIFGGGNSLSDRAREPFKNDLATANEQGPLQRSSSQRMNQPRQSQGMNGAQHRHSYSAADEPRNNTLQSYDLIDISLDSEHSTANTGNTVVSVPPRIPMRDLITF